jgi:hypothetical protein
MLADSINGEDSIPKQDSLQIVCYFKLAGETEPPDC